MVEGVITLMGTTRRFRVEMTRRAYSIQGLDGQTWITITQVRRTKDTFVPEEWAAANLALHRTQLAAAQMLKQAQALKAKRVLVTPEGKPILPDPLKPTLP